MVSSSCLSWSNVSLRTFQQRRNWLRWVIFFPKPFQPNLPPGFWVFLSPPWNWLWENYQTSKRKHQPELVLEESGSGQCCQVSWESERIGNNVNLWKFFVLTNQWSCLFQQPSCLRIGLINTCRSKFWDRKQLISEKVWRTILVWRHSWGQQRLI